MREIYFHEDDYCQLELVVKDNVRFCAEQMRKINEFAEAHKADIGWTAMYSRPENPTPLSQLRITRSDLVACMPSSMPAVGQVLYGADRFPCERTIAFGSKSSLMVFAELDDNDVVVAIWFTFDLLEEDIAVALDLTKALAKWPLLIADWGWSRVLPIDDVEALRVYFSDRATVFGKSSEEQLALPNGRQKASGDTQAFSLWEKLRRKLFGK